MNASKISQRNNKNKHRSARKSNYIVYSDVPSIAQIEFTGGLKPGTIVALDDRPTNLDPTGVMMTNSNRIRIVNTTDFLDMIKEHNWSYNKGIAYIQMICQSPVMPISQAVGLLGPLDPRSLTIVKSVFEGHETIVSEVLSLLERRSLPRVVTQEIASFLTSETVFFDDRISGWNGSLANVSLDVDAAPALFWSKSVSPPEAGSPPSRDSLWHAVHEESVASDLANKFQSIALNSLSFYNLNHPHQASRSYVASGILAEVWDRNHKGYATKRARNPNSGPWLLKGAVYSQSDHEVNFRMHARLVREECLRDLLHAYSTFVEKPGQILTLYDDLMIWIRSMYDGVGFWTLDDIVAQHAKGTPAPAMLGRSRGLLSASDKLEIVKVYGSRVSYYVDGAAPYMLETSNWSGVVKSSDGQFSLPAGYSLHASEGPASTSYAAFSHKDMKRPDVRDLFEFEGNGYVILEHTESTFKDFVFQLNEESKHPTFQVNKHLHMFLNDDPSLHPMWEEASGHHPMDCRALISIIMAQLIVMPLGDMALTFCEHNKGAEQHFWIQGLLHGAESGPETGRVPGNMMRAVTIPYPHESAELLKRTVAYEQLEELVVDSRMFYATGDAPEASVHAAGDAAMLTSGITTYLTGLADPHSDMSKSMIGTSTSPQEARIMHLCLHGFGSHGTAESNTYQLNAYMKPLYYPNSRPEVHMNAGSDFTYNKAQGPHKSQHVRIAGYKNSAYDKYWGNSIEGNMYQVGGKLGHTTRLELLQAFKHAILKRGMWGQSIPVKGWLVQNTGLTDQGTSPPQVIPPTKLGKQMKSQIRELLSVKWSDSAGPGVPTYINYSPYVSMVRIEGKEMMKYDFVYVLVHNSGNLRRYKPVVPTQRLKFGFIVDDPSFFNGFSSVCTTYHSAFNLLRDYATQLKLGSSDLEKISGHMASACQMYPIHLLFYLQEIKDQHVRFVNKENPSVYNIPTAEPSGSKLYHSKEEYEYTIDLLRDPGSLPKNPMTVAVLATLRAFLAIL